MSGLLNRRSGSWCSAKKTSSRFLERATVGVLLNNCPAVLTGVDLMNLLLLSAEELKVPPGCSWIYCGVLSKYSRTSTSTNYLWNKSAYFSLPDSEIPLASIRAFKHSSSFSCIAFKSCFVFRNFSSLLKQVLHR